MFMTFYSVVFVLFLVNDDIHVNMHLISIPYAYNICEYLVLIQELGMHTYLIYAQVVSGEE